VSAWALVAAAAVVAVVFVIGFNVGWRRGRLSMADEWGRRLAIAAKHTGQGDALAMLLETGSKPWVVDAARHGPQG
jgi:geranylgeranyl pyrophosphate synthase